jgi:hypothetical protein
VGPSEALQGLQKEAQGFGKPGTAPLQGGDAITAGIRPTVEIVEKAWLCNGDQFRPSLEVAIDRKVVCHIVGTTTYTHPAAALKAASESDLKFVKRLLAIAEEHGFVEKIVWPG